jgi:adenylosuccinate lyase
MSREDAYLVVQKAAMRAMDGQENSQENSKETGFRTLLEKDVEVMSRIGSKLDDVFDPWAGLEHTDLAYDRLGLGVKAK